MADTKNSMDNNVLDMSDEDFLNNPTEFEPDNIEEVDSDTEDQSASTDDDQDVNTDNTQDDEDETTDPDGDDQDHSDDGSDNDDKSGHQDTTEQDDEGTDKDLKSTQGELTDSQYAEVGRQIMGEFKANGTMMKVRSAEDAIQLMQMGANYHKKMSGLKPSLKTLKLLENNDLLDPSKLNYLIDLSQKKPEAIKKLLKESDLDPMTIDLDEENNYTPRNRTISDTEMVLDEVLESISSSPTYDRTLTVLSSEWDDASRRAIANEPELIRVINGHMEHGIFDQVANAVNYERSLGKLTGISDLEAYQRVGAYMNENNMFKSSTVQESNQSEQSRQDQEPQNSKSSQQNEERKNRKKAASPSRQRQAPSQKQDNYNPLAMSDEEFAKLNNLSL